MRCASAEAAGSLARLALIEAISARSAAARDCSACTLDCRSTFIAWSEDHAGFGVPPASAFAPCACTRSEEICLRSADRKSTRLNSSHVKISYAVFCLKKKNESKEIMIH